ncbi:increased loss of mitochondrial DNA protein 1 [Boeremia exigua]|uniref:increased loss of mitochondrial DNA protein 1 n=1 Tax=Boeremia exigua TaxID=749465 RepID=UPI001E8D7288|nr:increased loss of mitochondrial DNA protein 1 [Boeremia exigua]KAH6612671.1 increased loss of mitochondrial DNA protein 1 [Boeremia exigua]
MAIITANMMIRSLALFHLTLAALLINNPKVIANQSVIMVLGGSMQLPTPRDFATPSAAVAFIAVLFAFIGINDLTAGSLAEEVFDEYWGAQAPVRLVFLFALTGYTFLFKEGGIFGGARGIAYSKSPSSYLKNSVVFSWGFIELSMWFWIYITLREERRERLNKVIEKRNAEAEKNIGR